MSNLGFFSDPSELAGKPKGKARKLQGPSLAIDLMGCNVCGLWRSIHSPKMEPYGKGLKGIMIVGESPGKEEDEQGRPFVGKTGQLLARMLRGMGINLDDDCIRTNALQCLPGDKTKIPPMAYQACRARLDKQIKEFKPKLILAFGGPAITAMFPDFASPGPLAMHGRVIPHQGYKCWVACCFHPSFVLRKKGNAGEEYAREDVQQLLYEGIRRGLDHLDVPFRHALDPDDYEDFTGRANDAIEFLTRMAACSLVSFDYETTSLSPFNPGFAIASVSICEETPYETKRAGFIPIDHVEAKWTGTERVGITLALQKFLLSEVPKVIQNYAFEEIVTRKVFGIEVNAVIADTMVDAHLLDARKGVTGLEFQSFEYAGVQYKNMVDKTKIAQTSLSRLGKYNALDAKYTLLIHSDQCARKSKSMRVASDLFLRGTHALTDLHERGVKVDMDELDKQEKACAKKIKSCLDSIRESGLLVAGSDEELEKKLRSDDGIRKLLDGRGVKWDALTTGGKLSVDAKALQGIVAHDDTTEEVAIFIRNLLRYSKLEKMNSTYYKGFRKLIYSDGLLHPHFPLHTARSFRGSSVDPNFQNLPKRDEENKFFRRIIIPNIGDWLLEVDESSFEVRGIAMLSLDENLIAQVKAHWDFHKYWASRIYEKPEAEITGKQRYNAKNQFVFPNYYGCQPATSAAGLNQPLEKIEVLCKEFWEMYPGVLEWQRKLMAEYRRTACVTTPLGFVRGGLTGSKGAMTKNEVINTPVQGTCFHLLLDGLIRANEEMKHEKLKSQIIIEVHDSLTIDAVDAEIETVMEICNKHLTSERFDFQAGVPLEVEWSIGRNWCDMQDLSKG